MEKKVLTEILRIKELIGGKNLLTEGPLPVKILRTLTSIFKNESDDVVKKIIKSNDNLVEKLKNGNLNPEEAALVIKNAGGLEAFYYKTARETFNEKNYKRYYIDFQNLKKIGTMEKLQSYNDMIDQSVPNLLPNASEGYITEMKNMLKDELQTYIENKTKTNPFLQDVPNETPKKPKTTSNNLNNVKIDNVLDSDDEVIINKAIKDSFINKNIPLKYIPQFKTDLINTISELVEQQMGKISKNTINTLEESLELLNNTTGTKRQELVNKIITEFEKLVQEKMPSREIDMGGIKIKLKKFLLEGGYMKAINKAVAYIKFWISCFKISLGLYIAGLVADSITSIYGNKKAKQFLKDKGDNSMPGYIVRVAGGPLGVLFTFFVDFAPSFYNICRAWVNDENEKKPENDLNLGQNVKLNAFKLLLRTSTMPKIYIENVQYDATTEKFMYHHPNGTIYEIFNVGGDADTAFIRGKPTKKYPDGQKHYLTKFKKE
jgi:hypothetical protein